MFDGDVPPSTNATCRKSVNTTHAAHCNTIIIDPSAECHSSDHGSPDGAPVPPHTMSYGSAFSQRIPLLLIARHVFECVLVSGSIGAGVAHLFLAPCDPFSRTWSHASKASKLLVSPREFSMWSTLTHQWWRWVMLRCGEN